MHARLGRKAFSEITPSEVEKEFTRAFDEAMARAEEESGSHNSTLALVLQADVKAAVERTNKRESTKTDKRKKTGKGDKDEKPVRICYKCQKPGHFVDKCTASRQEVDKIRAEKSLDAWNWDEDARKKAARSKAAPQADSSASSSSSSSTAKTTLTTGGADGRRRQRDESSHHHDHQETTRGKIAVP